MVAQTDNSGRVIIYIVGAGFLLSLFVGFILACTKREIPTFIHDAMVFSGGVLAAAYSPKKTVEGEKE
jgi:hypothetical protein